MRSSALRKRSSLQVKRPHRHLDPELDLVPRVIRGVWLSSGWTTHRPPLPVCLSAVSASRSCLEHLSYPILGGLDHISPSGDDYGCRGGGQLFPSYLKRSPSSSLAWSSPSPRLLLQGHFYLQHFFIYVSPLVLCPSLLEMLLTIKQPAHQSYSKSFHDYTPPTPPSSSRFSPLVAGLIPAASRSLPTPSAPQTTAEQMSTPHRGLPLPGAMTLPQPAQQPPPIAQPPALSQPLGQLPAPPQQWQGAEESMRNWLQAKAEEDKRKQEEEKTRQESLRLEQRKIEQDMLRTSLSGGIPPYLVPMVFAGMGGGNLPNASLEWAQHYMAQAHQLQQQQAQPPQPLLTSQSYTSPEQLQRGDARSQQYPGQEHPPSMMVPSTPVGQSSQQSSGFVQGYQVSPTTSSQQLSQSHGGSSRQPLGPHLPSLNTGEIQIQPTTAGPSLQGHSVQQPQATQQQESSPSIYFHHWQPPTTQAGSSSTNQPTTPPGKH
jgi:hypothetical protein